MTQPTYRKPKPLPTAIAAHQDLTTREYKILDCNQRLGIPTVLIEELTGIKKATLAKIYENSDTTPLENIGQTDRMLAAIELLDTLYVVPTSDYGSLRSILGLAYTCKNLEADVEDLREKVTEANT